MTKNDFINLFRYDLTVNRQLANLLDTQKISDEYAIKVFAHLVNSQKVWLKRIKGEDLSKETFWPDLSLQQSADLIESNARQYEKFLNELKEEDLDNKINYRNSKGEEFNNYLRDILMHVIIHGGYHRGQIASAVRRAGGEPINTDYITYVRSNK